MIVRIIILFVIYFITARIGLTLDAVSGFATLIWLPTGISLAAVLLYGFRIWPGIFLGAFFANFFNGAPAPVALGIGVGNTLEALMAAFLLKKVNFDYSLSHLLDALMLIVVAAITSTMISATVGVSSLLLGGVISHSDYQSTWLAWWVGDMLSNLVIAPFLLVWSIPSRFNSKSIIESVLSILILIIMGIGVFGGGFGVDTNHLPITHLLFPPLIWITLRLGIKETTLATLLLSTIAVLATMAGFGPFISEDLSLGLLFLQSFIAVVAATTLILNSLISEKRSFEKRKDEFIGIASHELRTPLATVKGYIQIMQSSFQKSRKINLGIYLSKMENQIDSLTRLINDLLDVSKIQTDKLDLRIEKFNILPLVKDIIRDMQRLTPEHKILLEGNTEAVIFADKYRISQVLMNLISNAIKFSSENKKIIVRIHESKDSISISVKDFGPGIPGADHKRIFERFFQAAKTDSSSGLGLGLYISSQIIKKHQGKIWVESKVGKGTTFTFKLPLKSYKFN